MKLPLMIMLVVLPAAADAVKPGPQDFIAPMETAAGDFEGDVADTSEKLRKLMAESRLKGYWWRINYFIALHRPQNAQKALDSMEREFPDAKKDEPHVLEYYQGLICFWQKDFAGAYKKFDNVIGVLEQKYPNGIPPGKYHSINTSFMAEAYFNRGAAAMQFRAYERAVPDFDKAFALVPRAYMQVNKCRALLPLKRYREAAAAYDLAYEINPNWVKNLADGRQICTRLIKNDFRPAPCLKKGTAE